MWEMIDSRTYGFMGSKEFTHRTRVPGGWLVKHKSFDGISIPSPNALSFFPDPDSRWQVEEGMQKWELVDKSGGVNSAEKTFRLRVPGGWLVRVGYFVGERLSMAMTYLPDGNQEWTVADK